MSAQECRLMLLLLLQSRGFGIESYEHSKSTHCSTPQCLLGMTLHPAPSSCQDMCPCTLLAIFAVHL